MKYSSLPGVPTAGFHRNLTINTHVGNLLLRCLLPPGVKFCLFWFVEMSRKHKGNKFPCLEFLVGKVYFLTTTEGNCSALVEV